jgi:FtsH-binding integral membrane protein
MNNFNRGEMQNFTFSEVTSKVEARPLLRLVYLWMMFGLLTTAGVSWYVATNEAALMAVAGLILPIVIAEFVIIMVLSWAINRVPPMVAGLLFFVYSAMNGLTLGVIFYAYVAAGDAAAISYAFLTTAGLFGAMTILGFTTKIDLTKYSSFFLMGLIGLVIASIVNIFLASNMLYFIISVVGVLLFTALTAYDTQRILRMSALPEYSQYGDATTKLAIFGALQLYLDFINLFLFLLRLFGGGNRR